MPSELQYKAIGLYQYMIGLLWPSPIQWNSKTRQFSVETRREKLIPWYFITIPVTIIYGIAGCFAVPIRQVISPHPSVSLIQSLTLVTFGIIFAFCGTINWGIILAGEISCRVINNLNVYYRNLCSSKFLPN
jgi:hypothetical protein